MEESGLSLEVTGSGSSRVSTFYPFGQKDSDPRFRDVTPLTKTGLPYSATAKRGDGGNQHKYISDTNGSGVRCRFQGNRGTSDPGGQIDFLADTSEPGGRSRRGTGTGGINGSEGGGRFLKGPKWYRWPYTPLVEKTNKNKSDGPSLQRT